METCVGCGAMLAPTWKYCIHCGIAVDAEEIPGAIRPEVVVPADPPIPRRVLLLGGSGIFLAGLALVIAAIFIFVAVIPR
jgi:hypothetical protein